MIGKGVEVTPVVRLTKASEFPQRLSWLVETIIILHQNHDLKVIAKNEKYYRALGLKNQKDQVENMVLKIQRERNVALENLDNISKELVALFFSKLKSRVSDEDYTEILKQIK